MLMTKHDVIIRIIAIGKDKEKIHKFVVTVVIAVVTEKLVGVVMKMM